MKNHAPGTGGSPPELTELERVVLEVSRQVRWAEEQLTLYENESPKRVNDSSLAYLRGYGDALEGILNHLAIGRVDR